ncbi:MAG: AAA family ATPase [Candidatus Methanospirareceae archaeon]
MKLTIKNFKGIREGEIDFKNLNILIGGNNSGKTTVLEGLFLIPNPLRYVPYGKNKSAVSILSSLHSTLGEAYTFLLHEYTSDSAIISCSNVILRFQKEGDWIKVLIEEEGNTYHIGSLAINSSMEHKVFGEADTYIAKEIGETFYFHPSLMKDVWEYFSRHWVEFRGIGLPSKVAERISEGIGERYDDLLLEPFTSGSLTIYVRRAKDTKGIRLGDIGSGFQIFATLMLLYEFKKPKILMLDDIEAHINPSLLIHLASWLGDVLDEGTKIIISTHSLEVTEFIAGTLDEYEPQITLLTLRDGILNTKSLSLKDIEDLEKAGIDARMGEGVLI